MLSTNQSSCSVLNAPFEQGVRRDIKNTFSSFNPGYLAASAAGSMSLERKRSSSTPLCAGTAPGMKRLDQGCVSISLKVLPPFSPPAPTR